MFYHKLRLLQHSHLTVHRTIVGQIRTTTASPHSTPGLHCVPVCVLVEYLFLGNEDNVTPLTSSSLLHVKDARADYILFGAVYSMFGGMTTFLIGLYSYVADTSSQQSRTAR